MNQNHITIKSNQQTNTRTIIGTYYTTNMKIVTSIRVILGTATSIAFASAATCSVCSENGTLAEDYPGKPDIPMFGNYSDYESFSTCAEYDQYLSNITSEEQCLEEKLKWQFDLAFFCCEGESLDTNIVGGCSVCEPETRVDDPASITNITGGYPLINFPLNCQFVFDVAPHVKYHDMCKDFQNWYGDNICCNVSKTWTEPPTPSPTKMPTSTASANYVAGMIFTVAIGAGAALWQ